MRYYTPEELQLIVQESEELGAIRSEAGQMLQELFECGEVGQLFDIDLEHEDVDSVSGLVLTLLGRTPAVGDSVRYDRLFFEVHRPPVVRGARQSTTTMRVRRV